jgi:hypothetical protein
MAQVAWDAAMSSKILNATLPTGAAGIPGTAFAALNSGAMKLKLTSTASTGSASGTEIVNGTGYSSGGIAFANACSASSAGSNVTLPATAAMSCTATSTWSIVSLEITDAAPLRVWFGNWNGQPIGVAIGNTFQVAVAAISAGGM